MSRISDAATAVQHMDETWWVECGRTRRILSGPFKTLEQAQTEADNRRDCATLVRASREYTRRTLGCYYDPAD